MSEPRCECERVRREIRSKETMDFPIRCCPLHPRPTDEMLQATKPDHTGVLLAAEFDTGTVALLRFSQPRKLISLTPDQARALGTAMIRAAEMVAEMVHPVPPLPDGRPQ